MLHIFRFPNVEGGCGDFLSLGVQPERRSVAVTYLASDMVRVVFVRSALTDE